MVKLARLPDRTPVKFTLTIPPELNDALKDYAEAYREAYGSSEPVAELMPAMLAAFLESDREFMKGRDAKTSGRPR